jgi:anthranilate phosphoribosyltransferase
MNNVSVKNMSESQVLMRSVIQRVATGPELSKDVTREETHACMRMILEGEAHPVQAAIFLIALRMKRETDDELRGILDALRDQTLSVTAPVDEVVDISDPYDGYNRTLPSAPFVPAVLAACGVPAISQGVETIGPKFGCTHKRVLREAGVNVNLSPENAARRLADPACGWAYVDQSAFNPKLYALENLRMLIVKRPALTTIETALRPIRGRRKTHLVTGYVHKPYPRIYAMLAREVGYDSALLVRGVEGGIIPSLRQTGSCTYYHDKGEEQSAEINPEALGIQQSVRAAPLPPDLPQTTKPGDDIAIAVDINAMVKVAAQAGVEALEGKAGPVRDGIVLGSALCLWHLRKFDSLAAAADAARAAIDGGKALARLRAARE